MSNLNSKPLWIEKASIVGGEDHLGIQAISISHYATMLPGITNLTRRARYYSFYPWVLDNYIKRVGIVNKIERWRDFLRRSEFLYALISVQDGEEEAIPGARKATSVLNEETDEIILSDYADHSVKTNKRYWKYSMGIYGQYYLGALRDLDIIQYDEDYKVEVLGNAGKVLSQEFDKSISVVAKNKFFKAVEGGRIVTKQIIDLADELRPSKLTPSSGESKNLQEIFFHPLNAAHQKRVASLKLLLEVAFQVPPKSEIKQTEIRYTYLYGKFKNGKTLEIREELKPIYSEWKGFMIAEQLHYSMETMFWVILQYMYNWEPLSPLNFVNKMIIETKKAFIKEGFISSAEASKISFIQLLKNIDKKKIEKLNWEKDENSFYSIWNAIVRDIQSENVTKALSNAFIMYSKTISQYADSSEIRTLYGPTRPLGEHFNDLNPFILLKDNHLKNDVTLDAGLEYLFLKRIINRHLKVAVKKFVNIPQSKFKFRLHDQTLEWMDDIIPSFTTPRLASAMNILEDLGLVQWKPTKITKLGIEYLK
jgi:hypothetical protein